MTPADPSHTTTVVPASALLLDMDGVLVGSIAATERCWVAWAQRRGLDVDDVISTMHGRPSEQTIARYVPADEVEAEVAWVLAAEMADDEVQALPGAMAALTQAHLPVAVVTSALRPLALRRLSWAGLTPPAVMVTFDDVARGKPHPDPYLLGAERLGVDPARCVGVEDSPAGVESILAAGATPVGLATTYDADRMSRAHTVVADLSAVRVTPDGIGFD